MTAIIAPTLVFACGNPSRGDDALGPLLIERLSATFERGQDSDQACDALWDFQLQVEHALDLKGRRRVVLVDAALSGPEPYAFTPVTPAPVLGITTHALSPGGLLRVYLAAVGGPLPDCRLLAVRGYAFDLGAGLSEGAAGNLAAAERCLQDWLTRCPAEPG